MFRTRDIDAFTVRGGPCTAHAPTAPVESRERETIMSITEVQTAPALPRGDEFDLDITTVEMADSASLINMTDDGCGSTCGACVTGAA